MSQVPRPQATRWWQLALPAASHRGSAVRLAWGSVERVVYLQPGVAVQSEL